MITTEVNTTYHLYPDPAYMMNQSELVDEEMLFMNQSGSVEEGPDYSLPRTIHFIAIGVIIPVGMFCNTLAFIVFATSPSFRKSTTGHYLLSLAIADSIFLAGEFLRWLNTPHMHHLGIYINFMDTSDFMCKAINVIRYVSKLASAWITFFITIERYITVAYPLKVTQISTPRSAKLSIAVIWISSIVFGAFPLWTVGIQPYEYVPYTACLLTNETVYDVFNWISLRIGSLLLPGLLIMIFTVLIGIHLGQALEARSHKLSFNGFTSSITMRNPRPHSLERQLTLMLLAVSISFILLRLPYTVTYYINYYKTHFFPGIGPWDKYRIFFAFKMSDILVSVNYASNFFLYCVCGSTFRKQLYSLCRPPSDKHMTYSSHLVTSRRSSLRHSPLNHIELSLATKAMLETLIDKHKIIETRQ